MKTILKTLIIFFSINLLSPMAMAATPIRFATEATYPPFEYVDQTGQLIGFDIELAQALCQELKVPCTFANQSFSSLIPSLNLGKFDAIISALGVTSARQKQVDFTSSYYQPSGSFVAANDKHYTLKNILGKTIGVQSGSTYEKYLQDTYAAKVQLKTYASIQDAFLDLRSDRIDLVLADTLIAQAWLRQQNNTLYGIIEGPIVNEQYFGKGYAIAVRKNNKELLENLNSALEKVKSNGTYKKIVKKYFE